MLNNKWKHLECATILKLSVSTSYSWSKQEFSHPDDIKMKQPLIINNSFFLHYSKNKIAYIYLKTANRISLSKKVVCNHMIALKSQYFNFQKKKATIGKTMVTEGAYFRLNLFQIPYRYLTFILATTLDIDSHTWIIVRESFLGDKLRCSGETSHQRKNYSWQQRVIPNVKLEVT